MSSSTNTQGRARDEQTDHKRGLFPRLRPRVRAGAIVAVAVAVFLIVWLLLPRDEEPSDGIGPTAASVQDLREVARDADHSVYWAGELQRHDIELTRTASGRLYIRYLPEGTQVGDPRPNFLTIATYPQRNGFTAVSESTKERGTVKRKLSDGGLAVYNRRRPSSVFFSYPRARYQVEVYDPSPGRALRLVTSGRIVPIG